jgi:TonB family protein
MTPAVTVFLLGLLSGPWLATQTGIDTETELVPARLASAHLPRQPPLAADGGFAAVEAEITATGLVAEIRTVIDAPPFTQELADVVRLWRFLPAAKDGRPIASRVLVMGIFRPPVLLGGEGVFDNDLARVSEGVPFPSTAATPRYPPRALESGLVLVELDVDEEGDVSSTSLAHSSPGFDEQALEAARQFAFRPAHIDGRPVRTFALAVFGFRQPVTPARPRR